MTHRFCLSTIKKHRATEKYSFRYSHYTAKLAFHQPSRQIGSLSFPVMCRGAINSVRVGECRHGRTRLIPSLLTL